MSGPASIQSSSPVSPTVPQVVSQVVPQTQGHGSVNAPSVPAPPPVPPPPVLRLPGLPPTGDDSQQQRAKVDKLAAQLDVLLLNAAKRAGQSVSAAQVDDAVKGIGLKKSELREISKAAEKAETTFKALANFTGQDLGRAVLTRVDKKTHALTFDWNGKTPAGKAVREALDAQSQLSTLLNKALNNGKLKLVEKRELIEEAMFQCDRRQSEIMTVLCEFADQVNKEALGDKVQEDLEVKTRLDQKLDSILPQKTLKMHGTEAALAAMNDAFKPLSKHLDAFGKADAPVPLGEVEFNVVKLEISTLSRALAAAKKDGVDRSLLDEAAAGLKAVGEKLDGAKKNLMGDMLLNFARSAFPPPPKELKFIQPETLSIIGSVAPNLAKALDLRYEINALAKRFAKDPTQKNFDELEKRVQEYAGMNRIQIRNEISKFAEFARKARQDKFQTCPIGEAFCRAMSVDDPLVMRFGEILEDAFTQHLAVWRDKSEHDKTQVATFLLLEDYLKSTKGLVSQIVHLKEIWNRMEGMNAGKFVSGGAVNAAFNGELRVTTLVDARVHGLKDSDVDLALDDSQVEIERTLGSGKANTVYELTYRNGGTQVFKPEAAGRTGFANLSLAHDIGDGLMIAQLNMATQKTADALGLGDVVTKTSVGSHKGAFGIFMEKAPGQTAKDFKSRGISEIDGKANDRLKPEPGYLSAAGIKEKPEGEYAKIVGSLMRKANRLQWADLITGQGDRHPSNYMVAVRADGEVTLKGIDNDACCNARRIGLVTFRLSLEQTEKFISLRKDMCNLYPENAEVEQYNRLMSDPGVTKNEDGTLTVDASKVKAPELIYCLGKTFGVKSVALPDCIDEDLYNSLMKLKEGASRESYINDLKAHLPAKAVESAVNRLDEAIALAAKLKSERRVYAAEDWNDHEIQRELAGKMDDDSSPLPEVNGLKPKNSPQVKEVGKEYKRETCSYFYRDLMYAIAKPGWFD